MTATEPDRQPTQTPWWRLLQDDVSCVLERDPAARSRFEVWTIYPGIQAMALHRMAHALWRKGWRYLPRWMSFTSRWLTNIDIHPGAQVGQRFFIDHGAGVVIGETAVIGNDVTLYHGVTLGGTTWQSGKRHPTLGDGVVVGAGAKILGPIQVGHRVRVAANSVVIDDVPDTATVVGIPGRVVVRSEHKDAHALMPVDLNHHLIPDPVGKAIACLLERIHLLESELALIKHMPRAASLDTPPCEDCVDSCTHPPLSPSTGVHVHDQQPH